MGKRAAKGALATAAILSLLLAGHALAPSHRPARGATGAPSTLREPTLQSAASAVSAAIPSSARRRTPAANAAAKGLDCGKELRHAIRNWLARHPPAATPDEGITQALMRGFDDVNGQEHLAFARLLQRWPQDAGIAWMAWHRCLPTRFCDRLERAEHLVKVDRDNGAAWLALMDSMPPLDSAKLEYALARAGQAPTFDLRRGSIYVHLYPGFVEVLPSERCWQKLAPELRQTVGSALAREDFADLASHLWENLYTPPGFALEFVCQDRNGRRLAPTRRRDCATVLERFNDQPTIRDRSRGLRLLIRLMGGGAESLAWREEYRRLLWLRQNSVKLRTAPGSAARIWSRGEVDYFRELLREQGLWPAPPDWLPGDEGSRLLILEGR